MLPAGQDDVMGEERKPLAGNAARIYDILNAGEEGDEEDIAPRPRVGAGPQPGCRRPPADLASLPQVDGRRGERVYIDRARPSFRSVTPMPSNESESGDDHRLDYAGIVGTTGSITPWKVTAILALNARRDELEDAVAWASVESDGSGLHHEVEHDIARDSRVAAIFEILTADRAETED